MSLERDTKNYYSIVQGVTHMSTKKTPSKYIKEYKKTIVSLYQSGKTYSQLQAEYGVSSSALSNWVKK
jgi:transposase